MASLTLSICLLPAMHAALLSARRASLIAMKADQWTKNPAWPLLGESMLAPPASSPARDDVALYAFGTSIARQLSDLSCLSAAELEIVFSGTRDALAGSSSCDASDLQLGMDLFEARRQAKADSAAMADEQALVAAAAAPGALQTASGLVYEELATGDGACPTATDTVRLQYHGTLVDGTVFDSSIDRGMPLDFELSDVIRGWAEGLQQMRVGGKARLTIPSSLGYGQRGMGPVPPKATLIYEVELLAITTVPKLQR